MPLSFEPDRVAYLETAGWKAYYDHRWLDLLRLMLSLNRDEFNMPAPAAVLAAYYTVHASRAWAPASNEPGRAKYYLARFYRHARAHSGLTLDPERAASLELEYWELARRINREVPRHELLEAFTALHAEVFSVSPEAAAESAEYRTQAIELLREITGRTAAHPAANWRELEQRLRACYRSVAAAMQRRDSAFAAAMASTLAPT